MEGLQILTKYLFGVNEEGPAEQAQIEQVLCALEKLPAAQKSILAKRYGVGRDRCYTLAELAEEFGTDREAIRLQEAEALNHLKKLLK